MGCCGNQGKTCPRCNEELLNERDHWWCPLCDYIEPTFAANFTEVRKVGERR
jgi:hypothetical protein